MIEFSRQRFEFSFFQIQTEMTTVIEGQFSDVVHTSSAGCDTSTCEGPDTLDTFKEKDEEIWPQVSDVASTPSLSFVFKNTACVNRLYNLLNIDTSIVVRSFFFPSIISEHLLTMKSRNLSSYLRNMLHYQSRNLFFSPRWKPVKDSTKCQPLPLG